MPPDNLTEEVTRYNSFVESGVDTDFGKPKPALQNRKTTLLRCVGYAQRPRHALRVANQRPLRGDGYERRVIQGLYCGGESAGGFSQHGLARATCQGYIAGTNAVTQKRKS